jgi:hypothetical protein
LNLRCFGEARRQLCQVSLCPRLNQETRGLTNPVAEEVRSQAMGHVNSSIYEKSYRNQIVDADIISAFLETPSDEAIMKLMGHISLTRDPNAPAQPTSAQRRQVRGDPEVVAAKRLLDVSMKALRDRHRSVAAAKRKAQDDLTVENELQENTRLRKDHDSLIKRKLVVTSEIPRLWLTAVGRGSGTLSSSRLAVAAQGSGVPCSTRLSVAGRGSGVLSSTS